MRLTLDGKENQYGAFPEGQVLNAEITKCDLQEKSWIDNKTGEPAKRIVFEFRILDDDYADRKHWEDLFTSFYASEKCRLYLWTLKILGRDELPDGFTLDTNAFVGTKVPIMFSTRHYTKKDGTPGSAVQAEILSEVEAASIRRATANGGQVAESSGTTVNSEITVAPATAEDDDIEPF